MHAYAAGALWCIARDVESARGEIVAGRGVERLLRLLHSVEHVWSTARAQACGALTNLCRAEAARDRLGQVGGVAVLVALLERDDRYTRQTAGEALCNALSGHEANQLAAMSTDLFSKMGADGVLLLPKEDPQLARPLVGCCINMLRLHRKKSELRKAMKAAGIKKQLKKLGDKAIDAELKRFCAQALATWS